MNYFRRRIQELLTTCTALLVCVTAAQETPNRPYMNIKLSPEERDGSGASHDAGGGSLAARHFRTESMLTSALWMP